MIISHSYQAATEFSLHLFENSTGARCLDGTQYGIYQSPGFGSGLRNVIIQFWGGGLCEGRNESAFFSDCLARSQSNLGSSSFWGINMNYTSGFLAGLESESPNFYNWNRFDFPYCDGSFHQGNISNPVSFNGTELYFRGRQNVMTGLSYVMSVIDFKEIDVLVIIGGSTGGYATYTFTQYINDAIKAINPNVMVLGIPDSGFFVDYYNYITKDHDYHVQNKLFYEIVNKEVPPMLSGCWDEHPNELDLCLFPEYFVKFIKVPMLIIQSGYDSSNLYETVGLQCVQNNTLSACNNETKNYAHQFKIYQNNLIKKEIYGHQNFSAWLPACVTHCFDDKLNDMTWEVPENSGRTVNEVVMEFLKNPLQRKIYIDEMYWPENSNCAKFLPSLIRKI